jgi:hypothetical protein
MRSHETGAESLAGRDVLRFKRRTGRKSRTLGRPRRRHNRPKRDTWFCDGETMRAFFVGNERNLCVEKKSHAGSNSFDQLLFPRLRDFRVDLRRWFPSRKFARRSARAE